MANEFVARKGIVSSGSISVSGSVTASFFKGDASQLTNISNSSLPAGIISSSTQLPAGTISSSTQVDYNSIQNKLSGVVSSSTQVKPLLPGGTVTSSAQYPGWVTASSQIDITATTNYTTFSSSIATKNNTQDVSINALNAATSSYAINATIQSQLAGVVSSSAQVKPLLPDGTVTSSAQYPGWVTSSAQINTGSFSGSITTASYALTASFALNASANAASITISGSAPTSATTGSLWYDNNTGKTYIYYVSASVGSWVLQADPTYDPGPLLQDFQDVTDLGAITTNAIRIDNTTAAVSSGSGALIVSGGLGVLGNAWVKELYANTLNGRLLGAADSASYVTYANVDNKPTLVSSSAQIDYNSIQNKLSGVVSSSAQVAPLLPTGTVSSSAQYPGWVTASSQIQLSSITGTTFGNANFTFPQNLTVAGTLVAQEFYTELVSASVIFESGSTKFGNSNDDVMSVTGSIRVLGGNISGSFIGLLSSSAQVDYNSIQNKLSGVVSSSAQVQPLLPAGTVSSSAQYPGWVTASSQIDYNSIQNKLSGVVSSSAQVAPLLPANTISSSTQFRTITDPFTGSFTGSFAGTHTGTFPYASLTGTPTLVSSSTQIDYNSIQNKLSGVVSSSTQVQPLLPAGTVSSSAQYPGWVTSSAQIDYNSIQNKLSGVVSSSAQITPLLPANTISSSTQFRTITDPFTGSFTGSFAGTHTGTFPYNSLTGIPVGIVSSSTQVQPLLPAGTVSSSAQYPGWVTSSTQIIWSSVNYSSGIVSSSTQVAPLLPNGTVSSSAQYPGWVTSSGQISITSTNGYTTFSSSIATKNDIQDISINALNAATSSYAINSTIQSQLAGVVSSSTQVKPLLPVGTVTSSAQYPGWVTASSQIQLNSITGTTFATADFTFPQNLTVAGNLTAQQFYTEFVSASVIYESGSTKFGDSNDDVMSVTGSIRVLGGNISGSFIGLVSQSSQIDYNSIQNKLSGVVSSSTQVQPLLPAGTVSSSAQYPGWVTSSAQIDYNSIQNKLSGVISSSTQFNALSNTSASYAFTASYALNATSATPAGTVSSSTQFKTLSDPFTGSFTGSFKGDGSQLTGISTSSLSIDNYKFVGNGVITNYTLSSSYSTASMIVSVDGLNLSPIDDYTLTSTTLSLTTAPPSESNILVKVFLNNSNAIGTFTGSLLGTASYALSAVTALPAGVISSSTQFKILTDSFTGSFTGSFVGNGSGLTNVTATPPAGTVSSSAQYPGWVTASSQIDYNQIQNKLSGVVSSSTQVQLLLPGGTVSSSAQYPGWVTASSQVVYTSLQNIPSGIVSSSAQYPGWVTSSTQIVWSSVNYNSGIVSSSAQVAPLLPNGTVSSSAQYPGWVTASSQIDYNSIQNKLSGVVSSSAQVKPLLPDGTVTSSAQYPGWVTSSAQVQLNTITGTTFSNASFLFPQNLTVAGILTAQEFYTEYVSGSVIYESGSTKFGDSSDDVMSVTGSIRVLGGNISGSFIGLVSQSAQIDYNSIQNKLSGVVSSSAQVAPLLPNGTVSSSAQYPGWVTSSTQIVWSSVNYSSGIVSSSAQVQPLLPGGTVSSSAQYPGWVTASSQIDYNSIQNKLSGVVSSSVQVKPLLPDGTVSSSAQYPGWVTSSTQIDYNNIQNKLSGVVSTSAQVAPLLPNGTVSSSAQYPGWVTSSTQIVWSSVNYSAGIVSSSAQVKPLLPDGTVTSSAQYPGWVTASSQIDYNQIQNKLSGVVSSSAQVKPLLPDGTVSSSAQYPGWVTASTQIVYTSLQSIPQNIVSSSTQVKAFLPDGTVSSSVQYPGWVTSSAQIDYNQIQNKLSGVISSSTQFNVLTNTSASFAFTSSIANNFSPNTTKLTVGTTAPASPAVNDLWVDTN